VPIPSVFEPTPIRKEIKFPTNPLSYSQEAFQPQRLDTDLSQSMPTIK